MGWLCSALGAVIKILTKVLANGMILGIWSRRLRSELMNQGWGLAGMSIPTPQTHACHGAALGTPSPHPREGAGPCRGAVGCNGPLETQTPAAGRRAESLLRKHLFNPEFVPQNQGGPKVLLRRQPSRPVAHTHPAGNEFAFYLLFPAEVVAHTTP